MCPPDKLSSHIPFPRDSKNLEGKEKKKIGLFLVQEYEPNVPLNQKFHFFEMWGAVVIQYR